MFAESFNKKGEFTIKVNPQVEPLAAGMERDPKTGNEYPVFWLPCSNCYRLNKVQNNVVSYFCCDKCEKQ